MKLEDVIRKTFSLTPDVVVDDESGPGRLPGWDSLGHVTLISAIESEYGISIGMDEMISLEFVRDIRRLLGVKGVKNF